MFGDLMSPSCNDRNHVFLFRLCFALCHFAGLHCDVYEPTHPPQTSSFATACESCPIDCQNCTVENPNRVQQCRSVIEHTTSSGANGALESLTLQQGFWRSSLTSKEILQCYESSACVGGTEEYCNDGYQGPRECRVWDIASTRLSRN